MDTKLTLKLDQSHIETAKKYAARHHTSLSSLVEKYFAFLTDLEAAEGDLISPGVKRLSGVVKLKPDFNLKREKIERLSEKYG
jgi:hypothetical protein